LRQVEICLAAFMCCMMSEQSLYERNDTLITYTMRHIIKQEEEIVFNVASTQIQVILRHYRTTKQKWEEYNRIKAQEGRNRT
jgi:hypothetical protein